MKIMQILLAVVLLTVLASASLPAPEATAAPSVTGYAISWSSLDGGGSVNHAGTGYALSVTLAQPDAQAWSSTHYRLQGGFWQDWLRYQYLPFLLRN